MTEQQHPITPPPELVQQWLGEHFGTTVTGEVSAVELHIATQAARWGADAELEACCQVLYDRYELPNCMDPEMAEGMRDWLRSARRRQPSLKEKALAVLDDCSDCLDAAHENALRRALEQLDD